MLWGVKKDLEILESTISTIKDVLDDAEQCCLKNKQVFNWLRELKEVVYDADDLLDTFNLETEKRKKESYGQASRVIGNFLSNVNPIKRLKLGHKIKSINKRLDIIAAKRTKFHLQITAVGSREETYFKNRETLSMVDEDSICGRDNEREEIMSQLKQSDGNENISIISIVGLGGLGKTTLAQLVYNNEDDLKGYFYPKIWVYVSQDFDVGRIGLSEEMSLTLFKQRAFSGSDRGLNSRILEIAKELVKKCGGVPLALKALGSTMKFKKNVEEWLAAKNSEIWKTNEGNEGHAIYKQELLGQWMANGVVPFTRSMGGNQVDQGNEYFEQLVQISFLQYVDEEPYFTKVACYMHDLVHDLAQSICDQRILHINDADKAINKNNGKFNSIQTLTLSICKILEVPFSIGNFVCLEFLNLSECEKLKWLPESIDNLAKLRFLDLNNCKSLEKLPDSIGLVLETLPKSICNLSELSSLNLDDVSFLHGLPAGISKFNGHETEELSISCKGIGNENVHISELEHLNIRGYLEISDLEYFNDPGEATQANLKKKNNLSTLKLTWSPNTLLNDCIEYLFPVLEALQPPSSIKELDLEGYPGEQYPNWMMLAGETRMTLFPILTSLTLSHLKRCSSLPFLAELPHLEYLKLEGMLYLTICSGFFPSLVKLELHEMSNLEEVTTMKLDTENVYNPAFPLISELVISGCPKVRIQPHLPPSVVELKLENSNEELLGVEFFDGESSEIGSSSLGIRELIISHMETQLVLLKQLSSITKLIFQKCERNCLPESMRHLSFLRVLEIVDCKGLHALPEWMGELKSLENLVISETPLTCLHQSMKQLTALQMLDIWGCDDLRVLPEWFGELKSLKSLDIWETPLTCLPKSMKKLTALQELYITDCPELRRRCEREKGKDWHLISHIPDVRIF
ncbi:hypothetical protein LUZ63_013101 [Rhynchospora breviuscula]|uniref:Uncharacterized protein n=1 Tax=Rhynchospora breviuscula TaxID=2022672 RepID=A0A9Q0HJW5_9POAL|nr:hypothetical protein LUZ63_013101 [Rhynchospora breviuscula]